MISVLIPSKNEPYLRQTVDDVFKNCAYAHEILYEEDEGIGQRALTNKLARKAKGRYVMKIDAHCSFSKGFDKKLLEHIDDKTIMSPYLLPLDVDNWKIKHFPKMSEYGFDTNLVMQHLPEKSDEMIVETMCLQGSAWITTKDNYFNWNLGEEGLGSWGMQGTELGIKAYLNGGRCVTNKYCHYGHLFRTEKEDFPYERDMKAIEATKNKFVKKYKTKAIKGLIEKFNYPLDWTKESVANLKDVV